MHHRRLLCSLALLLAAWTLAAEEPPMPPAAAEGSEQQPPAPDSSSSSEQPEMSEEQLKEKERFRRLLEQMPSSYYGLTALDHFIHRQWRAAAHAYLKDIGMPMNRPFDSFHGLSNCHERLLEFTPAFRWALRALEERPQVEKLHFRVDYLRTRLTLITFESHRECLSQVQPAPSDDEWQDIDLWIRRLFIQRTIKQVPDFLWHWPMRSLECFLNRTLPLGVYFMNYDTQADIFLHLQQYDRARVIIEAALDKFPFAAIRDHLRHLQLRLLMARWDHSQALQLSNELLRENADDGFAELMRLTVSVRTGEHRHTDRHLSAMWTQLLRRWLSESPKSKCRRAIVSDWFVDSSAIVSKPLAYLPLVAFGDGEPYYVEDPETAALVDRSVIGNNSFVDKPAYLVRLSGVDLLPEYQMQSDCRRFAVFLSEENLVPQSAPASAQSAMLERIAITSPKQKDTFHNLVESASRLVVLLYEVLSREEFRDVYLMLDESEMTADLLVLLRIPIERVVAYEPHRFKYHIKELFFVDWRRPNSTRSGSSSNDWSFYRQAPPRWALQILRQWLWEGISRLKIRTNGKDPAAIDIVYATHADPSDVRTEAVEREFQLIAELRAVCERLGVTLHVFLDRYRWPLVRTAELFRNADIVIGPHGPALAYMLFCSSSTTIIEFPLIDARHRNYFGYIAASLGLDHWIVPEMSTVHRTKYALDPLRIAAISQTIQVALEIKGLI